MTSVYPGEEVGKVCGERDTKRHNNLQSQYKLIMRTVEPTVMHINETNITLHINDNFNKKESGILKMFKNTKESR